MITIDLRRPLRENHSQDRAHTAGSSTPVAARHVLVSPLCSMAHIVWGIEQCASVL